MKSLSIIQNFTEVIAEKPLDLILLEIGTGFYREELLNLSRHIHNKEYAHYENYKKALLTFTASGVFKMNANQLILTRYSQYVLISTVKISAGQIIIASKQLQDDPHTLAYFRSPSGRNLKIIVEVSTAWAYHKEANMEVSNYYSKLLALPIESPNRDLAQLCFYSFDTNLYHNPKNKIFKVQIPNY